MSHIETKAMELRNEAIKKISSNGFFQMLFGDGKKSEQAIEYFTRAGNLFKTAKNWLQAGIAFNDAAELNIKQNDAVEATYNYIEAAKCFTKVDIRKGIEYYLKAINLFLDKGKFIQAAKYHQVVADLYEEMFDINGAITHFEQAGDYYKQESNHTSANKCLNKVGEIAAMNSNYAKAIKIFQEIACFDLSSSLLKYNAKEYFFKAAICHLCNDPEMVETILNKYVDMHPAFRDSREYQLVVCLLECIQEQDTNSFANAIRIFDSTSKLSSWHVNMLMRAKNYIDNIDIK